MSLAGETPAAHRWVNTLLLQAQLANRFANFERLCSSPPFLPVKSCPQDWQNSKLSVPERAEHGGEVPWLFRAGNKKRGSCSQLGIVPLVQAQRDFSVLA